MDYKKAGVDIEAGYKSVELMKKHVNALGRGDIAASHKKHRHKNQHYTKDSFHYSPAFIICCA